MFPYVISKTLTDNLNGTVNIIRNKTTKKKYIMKTQKILTPNLTLKSKSRIWREIQFGKFTKKYPRFFSKLVTYNIVTESDYRLDLSDESLFLFDENDKMKKHYQDLSDSKFHIEYVYELKDGTIDSIFNKLTRKQFYSFIIQIIHIILLLKSNGYRHFDMHLGNIAYTKVKKDGKIKIFGKQIKTYGYLFSIIDFGAIYHTNYKFIDSFERDTLKVFNNDFDHVLGGLLFRLPLWKDMIKNGVNSSFDVIKKQPYFNSDIKPFLRKGIRSRWMNMVITLGIISESHLDEYCETLNLPLPIDKIKIKSDDLLFLFQHSTKLKQIATHFISML